MTIPFTPMQPVFVVGCPRSGTTLLYHMLLSAGGFAVYRYESHVFSTLAPRFRNLRSQWDREQLMDVWLRSEMFARSGLEAGFIRERVMRECRNGGDFLRTVMQEIARSQGVERWAETTPEHILHLIEIKRTLPDALIIHVIRDGRDVALSLAKQGWIRPFPWDAGLEIDIAGLYWEWVTCRGRELGRRIAPDYLEVTYEDLVTKPQPTLDRVGAFIHHLLDYKQILRAGIGSVSKPNTSFLGSGSFIGRWRQNLSPVDVERMEETIGPTLQALGYETTRSDSIRSFRGACRREMYQSYFGLKFWLKCRTPLGGVLSRLTLFQPDCGAAQAHPAG